MRPNFVHGMPVRHRKSSIIRNSMKPFIGLKLGPIRRICCPFVLIRNPTCQEISYGINLDMEQENAQSTLMALSAERGVSLAALSD
jgi:hypothetical protein